MGSGTLLDERPLPVGMWPANAGRAHRVVYRGTGYDGAGREVSGSVFLPAGAAPREGWPVVSYAHGTTGLADHCAPSRTGLSRLEREHVDRWLAAGFVVAATDYEGLATAGPHPYFNGEAVADDVIDIVRATRRLDPGVAATWLVAGFSQGGHAALFTGLLAARYAPELDFRGTVALAPPVHLPLLVGLVTADGAAPVSVLLPFLLAGLRTSHPRFDPRPFLTGAGAGLVETATTATLVEMFRAAARLTNDEAGITGVHTRPGVAAILRACRVPVCRMDRPVLVSAGAADEIVPVEVVERFVADLGRAGVEVSFHRHPDARHAEVLVAGHDRVLAWARRALAAGPVPDPVRFGLFDADGDGHLTADDYEVFALRLVQAFGEPPGSPRALAVRAGYRALWQAIAARTDADADGRVDQAEFRAGLDPAGFDREVRPLAEAVLGLADADGDGRLDAAELTRLLRACEVSPAGIDAVATALDTDHDGAVRTGELLATVRDFCLDPAPGHPGHWLFGRC